MDNAKRHAISEKLIFIFFILFPFGQIIRIPINYGVFAVTLHPIDLVTIASLILWLLFKYKKPTVFISIIGFLGALMFSWILALYFIGIKESLVGAMYLLRIISYASFFFVVWDFVRANKKYKERLFYYLVAVLVFVGIFGWVQYLIYPDLRSFAVWGWDDHLYRLTGSYLDPGFTGILLIFGFLSSYVLYLKRRDKRILILMLFFFISIGFTYSRASYLAFLAGVFSLLVIESKKKLITVFIGLLLIGVLILPRPASSGTELERLYSVFLRIQNYKETIEVWKQSPLFGVGYNNMCEVRSVYYGMYSSKSHACSGSDSSLLLLLATVGMVGLFVFIGMINEVRKNTTKSYYTKALISCSVALLIHSLFVNSLFYPWVMGWIGILLAISIISTTLKNVEL